MEAKIKTPQGVLRKIQILEKKVIKLQEKNKEKSAELKKSRSRVRYLEKSRDNWKTKNKYKSLINKQLSTKIRYLKTPRYHSYSFDIIKLSTQLRHGGRCSYKSICRILLILQTSGYIRLGKLPCANTIQNWMSKMGLYELNTGHNKLINKEVCIIIDQCIKVGEEKMLLVLACPAMQVYEGDKLPKKGASIISTEDRKKLGNGLSFDQVKVLHIEGRTSWKGPAIKEVLLGLKKDLGLEFSYILSDEGSNLKNAASLLNCPHIPDISHAIGSCLRNTFKKQPAYKGFIKLVGAYQSKLIKV